MWVNLPTPLQLPVVLRVDWENINPSLVEQRVMTASRVGILEQQVNRYVVGAPPATINPRPAKTSALLVTKANIKVQQEDLFV
jgi:hypothetical protein